MKRAPAAAESRTDQAPVSVAPGGRTPPAVQGEPLQAKVSVPSPTLNLEPSFLQLAPRCSSALVTLVPGVPVSPFRPVSPLAPAGPVGPEGPAGPADLPDRCPEELLAMALTCSLFGVEAARGGEGAAGEGEYKRHDPDDQTGVPKRSRSVQLRRSFEDDWVRSVRSRHSSRGCKAAAGGDVSRARAPPTALPASLPAWPFAREERASPPYGTRCPEAVWGWLVSSWLRSGGVSEGRGVDSNSGGDVCQAGYARPADGGRL